MLLMSQVISNISPLTNLAVIGQLELVQIQLSSVAVPDAVWQEMLALPHREGRAALLAARTAGWLRVAALANPAMASSLRLAGLDKGESEAIAIAVETSEPLLLIDEKKGRMAARRLGVPVAGALNPRLSRKVHRSTLCGSVEQIRNSGSASPTTSLTALHVSHFSGQAQWPPHARYIPSQPYTPTSAKLRPNGDNLQEINVDVLPRLSEVEGKGANAVAVGSEFDGEVASCARVKEDALSLPPTNFTGLLTQVGIELIEIG